MQPFSLTAGPFSVPEEIAHLRTKAGRPDKTAIICAGGKICQAHLVPDPEEKAIFLLVADVYAYAVIKRCNQVCIFIIANFNIARIKGCSVEVIGAAEIVAPKNPGAKEETIAPCIAQFV